MKFLKCSFRFRRNKGSPSKPPLASTPRLIDVVFQEYINNEIPAHFIDTSSLRIVSRKDLRHIFKDEIENTTEGYIQEQIRRSAQDCSTQLFTPADPSTVLKQIVQEIVKYNILSYRWDEVMGEPTYQDIANRKNISKFTKLAEFCKASGGLGRKLVWVDTCCIDKTNSAELSEAIHGMYKWYANSYTCIVHLAESTSYEGWIDDSWFTRGWTLQELLAPKRVKFYGKNWQPLAPPEIDDDRKFDKIISHLEKATGISQAVLTANNSHGVYGCSFWEIMSWASKRRTTRIEDRAYSLIGLFHIVLPIAYGEGEQAFFRLVQAIAARDPSWDVFVWFGQPSAHHFAVPSSPEFYPRFEADMSMDRTGVRRFAITAHELSLKALPLVPMELYSVEQSKEPGKQYLVYLKPRYNSKSSIGRFGNLVVECGATRLKTIQGAEQLSACIINHHGARNQDQGRLKIGSEYICFLLYTERGKAESTWMKLVTNNLLRMSCLGATKETTGKLRTLAPVRFGDVDVAEPDGFVFPLVTTVIKQPPHTRSLCALDAGFVDSGKLDLHPFLRYSKLRPPTIYDLRREPLTLMFQELSRPPLASEMDHSVTRPPTKYMRVYHSRLPWYIDIRANGAQYISLADFFQQLFASLDTRISKFDFYNNELDDEDRDVLTRAYLDRCRSKDERMQGVKRVDFLRGKFEWMGISPGKDGMWHLNTV